MKLAAIDIGSNAIRLAISRIIPTVNGEIEFKKVEFIRIPLRLGNDVFKKGKISKEKQRLFLMTMNAFKLIMDIHEIKYYRANATSAMREAKNGKELSEKVLEKHQIKIDIISGAEESRIVLKSVIHHYTQSKNFMNIDVGGGSTEITLVQNNIPVVSRSFDIGAVRLKEGLVKAKEWSEMETWLKENTAKNKPSIACGTGGNINRLHRILAPNDNDPISLNDLEILVKKISETNQHDRVYEMKMNPDRADVIDFAGNIYVKAMHWANVDKIIAPNIGLKDGLMLELWEDIKDKR